MAGVQQAGLLRDQRDPEAQLARTFDLPAPRSFILLAHMRGRSDAPDNEFDALVGASGAVRATGSARFESAPAHRASSALDGDPKTAWIGAWVPGHRAWLGWRTREPRALRQLRLVPPRATLRRPTTVRVTVDGHATGALAVADDGAVALPSGLRGTDVRIDVLDARFPPGTGPRLRQRRAVAVAEVVGGPRMHVPRSGPLDAPCERAAALDGHPIALRPVGDIDRLDAGAPLSALSCGGPLRLAAGEHELLGRKATLVLDQLGLFSVVTPAPAAGLSPGRVLSQGDADGGSRSDVRVDVDRPAWLVLGESYNRGWRATCDGRSLGAPQPLQGYANGWPVAAGCRAVSFRFGPDRLLLPFYLLSLVFSLAFLALIALRRRDLRAQAAAQAAPAAVPVEPEPAVWKPAHAALAGLVVFGVVGFVFALRAGAVAGPAIALLLYLRLPTQRLVLAACGALAVVVPVLYIAFPGRDAGGYSSYYPTSHLGAHWVAVGAVVLLALALVRSLRAVVARR